MRSKCVILLLCLICLRTTSVAGCKKARPDQIPHGARLLIVQEEQTVGHLQGTVVLVNYKPVAGPVSGAVVEIYLYGGRADEITQFLGDTKRNTACLTDKNGTFAFRGLKPGRYLLRAGTAESAGINELHAIFRVTGKGKTHAVRIRSSLDDCPQL